MKKYFYLLAIACATVTFTACNNDDDAPKEDLPTYDVVTFDGTTWDALIDNPQYGGKLLYGEGGDGYKADKDVYEWTDATTSLHSKLNNSDGSWCYWKGGAAVSNYNSNVSESTGSTQQLSIPTGLKAHSGSNFLMLTGYNSSYGDSRPVLDFKDGKARKVLGLWYTASAYFNSVMKYGNNDSCPKATSSTNISVVFEGFDSTGKSTGTVSCTLQNGTTSMTDWTYADLSKLGTISSLKVDYTYTDDMKNDYGYCAPGYVAVDDITIEK